MKLTKKCKKCDGTGQLPNPDFEYCAKLSEEDREKYGLTIGDCDHCEKAIQTDCKRGEFIDCLQCEGKGMTDQTFDIEEEADILDILLKHGDLLTCYNCGKKLTDVHPKGEVVAEMCLDPGRSNYPREPDEPAEIYFRCADCIRERDAKKAHPEDCGCCKCSGEDRALELMERGIVRAERSYSE